MQKDFHIEFKFYLLIVLTGIVAGFGAVVFRDLIALFHNLLFYGQLSTTYNVLLHSLPSPFGLGIIFAPMLGAVCVVYLVKNFAPEAKGHGVPEVMDAIHYKQGKVRPVVALIKAIASSLSIGSGGSVGREGPIIQIGAAFGSTIGQWVSVANWQRITLIACGAGGGIAATFNTPFGGILFAIELMLPELSPRTLIPVIIATTIATYTSYIFLGDATFIPFNTSLVMNGAQIGILIGLSFIFGLLSTFFIHTIYYFEDVFALCKNYYVRHVFGMFLVGVSVYFMLKVFGHYYIQGVGYATVLDVLTTTLTNPIFLLFLAFLKLVETSITLGSGGSGGVFSPLLFIGATFGAGCMGLVQYFYPEQHFSLALAALAGMASMVGASTGAPLTAIIMTAELTADYTIILPLMIIVAIACLIRRSIMRDTVYTLKLTRRGEMIPEALSAETDVMR
jgi:CIC family chloride channel protein